MRKALLALIACLVAVIAYATPGSPYLSYGWRPTGDPYWSSVVTLLFNENANNGTTFTDQSNSAHTVTNTGGDVSWTAPTGTWGVTAPSFVGKRTAVAVFNTNSTADYNFSSGSWTISVWAQVPDITSTYSLLDIEGTAGNNYGMGIEVSAGVPRAWFSSNGTGYNIGSLHNNFGAVTTDTNWHNYEVDFDGAHYYLFYDGTLESTITSSTSIFYSAGNSTLLVGEDPGNLGCTNCGWASLRITKGVARHTASFTLDAIPLPTH